MICLIWFANLIPSYAQDAKPLTAEELRETAANLVELKTKRAEVEALKKFITDSQDLAERERLVHERELDVERQLRLIAERERDVETRRGDDLEALLKAATRRPGIGCRLKRFFTLGLARCG